MTSKKCQDQIVINPLSNTELPAIKIPGYGLLHIEVNFFENNIYQDIKFKITGSCDNRSVEIKQDDSNQKTIVATTTAMKTSSKVVGFTQPIAATLIQSKQKNMRKKKNTDIEPCGCRKHEHLPNCKIYHYNNRELYIEDSDSDEHYHLDEIPIESKNLNILQTIKQQVDQLEEESMDLFDSIDNVNDDEAANNNNNNGDIDDDDDDDDDDEVIPSTPQKPSRRIQRNPPPSLSSYQRPNFYLQNELESRSHDLFSNSDEVIEDSRIYDNFPRRHRHKNQLHLSDPQAWINLTNKTIIKTAITFRELSNIIEQRFDEINQMILNLAASLPTSSRSNLMKHEYSGIQSDNVEIPESHPNAYNNKSSRRDAGTETETRVTEQIISETQNTIDSNKHRKKITKNVITKTINEKISHVNHNQQQCDIVEMRIKNKCDLKKCDGCQLLQNSHPIQTIKELPKPSVQSASSTPKIKIDQVPITSILFSPDAHSMPSNATAITDSIAPSSSVNATRPLLPSLQQETQFDTSGIITLDTTELVPEVIQTRRGGRRRQQPCERHDNQHLQVPPTTSHPYNLRPRSQQRGNQDSDNQQRSHYHHNHYQTNHHASVQKKTVKRQ